MARVRAAAVTILLLLLCAADAQAARLELGLASQPGGAAAVRKAAPFGYRYQYLAGGVNTGDGWATWNENGSFVTRYVDEPRVARMTPVFTYSQVRQSSQGRDMGESDGGIATLRNAETMRACWGALALFFRR